jgi:hypothetical protein
MQLQGQNLIELWGVEGGTARQNGRHAGGRRRLSGREMIRAAATKIRTTATAIANTAAEASGLGPCQLAAAGGVESRGRPTHSFSIPAGHRGAPRARQFQAAAYHVTWAAHHNRPPPQQVGLTYSHLCARKRCVNALHGVWEDILSNSNRKDCVGGAVCPHHPRCLV